METYTPGYSSRSVDFMRRRRAATHAAFFIPYLRPDMRLLDCGCGPGTITIDLAGLVAEAVGIDQEDLQFEQAPNVRFQAASVYALPFPDAHFDAVFSHALFEHLRNPAAALAEIQRVLRPGGVVGFRAPDWGGFLIHPMTEALQSALDAYQDLQRRNGGDVRAGRKLASMLRQAGFQDVRASASFEIYREPELIGEFLASQLAAAGEAQMAETWRIWTRDPDALFAQAWGEAVARSRTIAE